MSFHPTRFPLDIALGARGGPERTTDIVTLSSGREERNSRWAQSRRRYNAGYGVKSRAEMQAVLAFFEERRGRFHSFLWRDGLDHSSGADTPTALDQAIGTGDGSTTAFQLIKVYGAAFDPYVRPITKPVEGSVKLAVDGVELASGGFTVNTLTGVVTLAAAPGDGVAVTAGFLFDVPVRFDTDRLDIELSSFDAADVPAIPLIEVLE
ncbi:MAG: phage distal tail protein, Rcc01695 family [Devosia sp.]